MIGVIGFGRFGRLAVKHLVKNFDVGVFTPSGKFEEIEALGAKPVSFAEAANASTLLICVPIAKFDETLEYAAPFLRTGALVIDVCSVKEYPVACMEKRLPGHAQILATHPMFGPDSAAAGLAGSKIVLWPQRMEPERYDEVKAYLSGLGLKIIEADPQRHDYETALSLALPHFIGRGLENMGLEPLDIDTEGYKRLLHILGVVTHDTWQLFMDMQNYNQYAKTARKDFMAALAVTEGKINA